MMMNGGGGKNLRHVTELHHRESSAEPPSSSSQERAAEKEGKKQQVVKEKALFIDTDDSHSTVIDKASKGAAEEVNRVLCEKLTTLSIAERTQGTYDLHGVVEYDLNEEGGGDGGDRTNNRKTSHTKQITQQMLNEITQIAFSSFADSDTGAFRKAISLNAQYVDYILRLCLQADDYNPQKAARRVVSFFQYKQKRFGDSKLGREILLQDLPPEVIDALYTGKLQLLQQRDRAGRAVIWRTIGGLSCSSECLAQMYYFVVMNALKDVETQTKGIVYVYHAVGQKIYVEGRLTKLAQFFGLMPVRLAAVHFCRDVELVHDECLKQFVAALETDHLCRFRIHCGTYQDCIYKLMTFGIPHHLMSIDPTTGEPDVRFQHYWLDTIRRQEEKVNSSSSPLSRQQNHCQPVEVVEEVSFVSKDYPAAATTPATPTVALEVAGREPICLSSADVSFTAGSSNVAVEVVKTSPSSVSPGPYNQEEAPTIINIPCPLDIIVGRSKKSAHPQSSSPLGYMKLRQILENHRAEYEAADRSGKTIITLLILQKLRESGCRFLRCTPEGLLQECTELEARDKISHSFRNMRQQGKTRTRNRRGTTNNKRRINETTATRTTAKIRINPIS